MNIEVGDYITFKAATRYSYRKVRRKVNGFWLDDRASPTVRYQGHPEFIVQSWEVSAVEKA